MASKVLIAPSESSFLTVQFVSLLYIIILVNIPFFMKIVQGKTAENVFNSRKYTSYFNQDIFL